MLNTQYTWSSLNNCVQERPTRAMRVEWMRADVREYFHASWLISAFKLIEVYMVWFWFIHEVLWGTEIIVKELIFLFLNILCAQ